MPRANTKSSKRHPELRPVHPGAILREFVQPALDQSPASIAKALGIITKHLDDLVHERIGLTPELAVRLEAAFDRSAPAWLRLQDTDDLWHARKSVPRLTAAA